MSDTSSAIKVLDKNKVHTYQGTVMGDALSVCVDGYKCQIGNIDIGGLKHLIKLLVYPFLPFLPGGKQQFVTWVN